MRQARQELPARLQTAWPTGLLLSYRTASDSVFHQTAGCFDAQPPNASSSAARDTSSGSLLAGPINCTPIGNPSEVKPAGTLIEGHPNTFHGHVTGQAAIICPSVAIPL